MRVLFAGGGTGGHIFPALALARHLQQTVKAEVLFVGTSRGMETKFVPQAGFPLETIPVEGFSRRLSPQLLKSVFTASRGVVASLKLVGSFRPHIVVGTGGYVAGPVVLAAWVKGVPTIIHEQNAIPGLTNKLLSRFARRVCLSFPAGGHLFPSPGKVVVTGNPRASEAAALLGNKDAGVPGLLPGVPVLTCVGGSHGALRLNEAFSCGLENILRNHDVQVVYVTGERYFAELEKKLNPLMLRFPGRLHLLPFHSKLPRLLSVSSLLVSRAGATTLAEITALGLPAVLVPSPNVVDNHQEHNARVLSEHGAAVLLSEDELDRLPGVIGSLLESPHKLEEMSARSRELGFPDAAEKMTELIISLAKKS